MAKEQERHVFLGAPQGMYTGTLKPMPIDWKKNIKFRKFKKIRTIFFKKKKIRNQKKRKLGYSI